jgi:hypothetical protein
MDSSREPRTKRSCTSFTIVSTLTSASDRVDVDLDAAPSSTRHATRNLLVGALNRIFRAADYCRGCPMCVVPIERYLKLRGESSNDEHFRPGWVARIGLARRDELPLASQSS